MRYYGGGINWQWYHTDTYEEAVEWFKELTGKAPGIGDIVEPIKRSPAAEFDDKYGFRLHR